MVVVVVEVVMVVVQLWRPGGSFRGGGVAGGSLLEGAGQGCSQLGAVCRHRGGHWAMLPVRGPLAPTSSYHAPEGRHSRQETLHLTH